MSASVTVADVILRDGRTLRLRPPTSGDQDALAAFLARLSPESLRLRFFATVRPDRELVGPYLDPNWSQRGALIGSFYEDGDEQVIALASYARLRDPRAAEVAFAVADDLHGFGIATRMLEQIALRASAEGIERLVFEILPDNSSMLAVVAGAGFEVARSARDGVVEVSMSIDSTGDYVARVDERDHGAIAASLAHFLDPASVAVYGASPRRGTIGGELLRNIVNGGFERPVYPVNRGGDAVAGVPGVRSLRRVEPAVELALICVPAEAVLDAATDALAAGALALRHLCGLRRGRQRRRRAAGSPARAGARPRRTSDRPELPWHRRERGIAERHVRSATTGRGQGGVRIPERCARPRGRRASA